MNDYAVVLNAGSSSLKFCVSAGRRPTPGGWKRGARSKASAPHRVSPRRTGPARASPSMTWTKRCVQDGRTALDALAAWLRCRYSGCTGARGGPPRRPRRGHVLRPHHRHTGCPGDTASAGAAGSAPPAAQPRRDRRRLRAAARRAAGGLLRHELSSRAVGRRRAGSAAPRRSERRRATLRLPRTVVRIHRLGSAAGGAGNRRPGA